MFQVAPEDVLRGLKRSKRLAKQDLLFSSKTANPQFWTTHAEARRRVYDLLMETIEREGLDSAYQLAQRKLAALKQLPPDERSADASLGGEHDALSHFLGMLGLGSGHVDAPHQDVQPEQEASPSVALN